MYRKILLPIILTVIMAIFGLNSVMAAEQGAKQGVTILCYHDVVDKPYNVYTLTPGILKEHLAYLKNNAYNPISLDQYIDACKTGAALPDKAVLLTFDDGYQAFYTTIFPLLKEYNYPAVFAIVTSWTEYSPPDVKNLLTWDQVRELDKSGLITIASHSHQSHRSVISNPQGDRGQMMETRQYINGQYESLELYQHRVKSDFQQTQAVFAKELGHTVKTMVWPYGAYTQFAVDSGREEGFEVFLGLDGGLNAPSEVSLSDGRRGIIENTITGAAFSKFLKSAGKTSTNMNVAQLDIDIIYDAEDANETEHNLDLAIERFNAAGVNTVFLQAFSDTNGSGNIESVYFHTTEAPVKADIFSHITARLTAEGFAIYAWMPTLACQWLLKDRPEDTVLAYDNKGKSWYKRATPFSPATKQHLQALFADLAAYSFIDGILFQDDLYLNDYEDFSPAGKLAFKNATGKELTPEILKDTAIRNQWTQIKSNSLIELTQELTRTMKKYHPYLATARNIYPTIITEPESEEWFAQNYKQYLSTYDYTIIMAYPYMEKQSKNTLPWLGQLADIALQDKANVNKTIFKLQTYDWDKKVWLSAKELNSQRLTLKNKGVINFAYYPENVFSE